MASACLLAIVFCLSVGIVGPEPGEAVGPMASTAPLDEEVVVSQGRISLGFGAVRVGLFRDVEAMADFLRALIALWGAGTVGLFAALLWTSGIIPGGIDSKYAPISLTSPMPRWSYLLGQALAAFAEVAAASVLLIVGTWLALGVRLGSWDPGYLLAIPILLLNFAAIYASAMLLAVWTRSAALSAAGAIGFWAACALINHGRQAAAGRPVGGLAATVVEAGYWLLPKPADALRMLDAAVGASAHFTLGGPFDAAPMGPWHLLASVATTVGFIAAAFALASSCYARLEY